MKPAIGLLLVVCVLFAGKVYAASEENQFDVAKTKVLYLLSERQFAEAIQFIEGAEFDFSDDALNNEWLFWQAVAYARSGQPAQAISRFNQLKNSGYEHPQLPLEYGIALVKADQFKDALVELSNAVELDSGSVQGQYYLGLAHYEMASYSRARTPLRNLLNQLEAGGESRGVLLDQTRYLLAATETQLANYSSAKNLLNSILVQGDSSAYFDAAQNLMQKVEALSGTDKPFFAKLNLTLAADTNVRLANESDGVDARGSVQLNTGYVVNRWFIPKYQFFASKHGNADDYNLMSHRIIVESPFSFSDVVANASYAFNAQYLAETPWYQSHEVALTTRFSKFSNRAYLQLRQSDEEQSYRTGLSVKLPNIFEVATLPVSVSGSLDGSLDEDFATVFFAVQGLLDTSYRSKDWLFGGSFGLQHTQYAPTENIESENLMSLATIATKQWGRGLSTSVKLDGFYSIAQPESSGYQRAVAAFVLGWSY